MSETPETPAPEPTPTPTPMPEIADRQFSLLPDGSVTFQPMASNPLPGEPVAALRKGPTPLAPAPEITDPAVTVEGMDAAAFAARLSQWLAAHIRKVLEPLFALENLVAAGGSAGAVAQGLLDGLGVARRADLATAIAELETDGRTALRQKKVRLGPAFLYLLEGNKPASVKLRAILWALWNDRPLPPPLPHDGAVSAPCPDTTTDPAFWTAIGYPLCGARIVRVDMHDRLVQSIYDAAEKGIFRAKHEMAEWLGCPISEMYAVLEALGHRRIEEQPAPPQPTAAPEPPAEESKTETPAELDSKPDAPPAEATPAAEQIPATEDSAESSAAPAPVSEPSAEKKPEPPKKPELARFRLGPAPGSVGRQHHGPRNPRPPRETGAQDGQSSAREDRKPFSRKDRDKGNKDRRDGADREHGNRDGRKGRKDGGRPDREPRGERPERILRAEAKIDPEDSPFAILRNFKTSGS